MILTKIIRLLKGGQGSGNFDHAGRPGERGGSSSEGGGGGFVDSSGKKITMGRKLGVSPFDRGQIYFEGSDGNAWQYGSRGYTNMGPADRFISDVKAGNIRATLEAGIGEGSGGGYSVGSKTWHRGDEVTITSKPYNLHGGEFQDAVTESGKKIVIPTKAQTTNTAESKQREFKEQQDQFRRLRDKK